MAATDELLLRRRHRITADEYHRLGDAGVLAPETATPGVVGIAALPGVSVDLSGLLG